MIADADVIDVIRLVVGLVNAWSAAPQFRHEPGPGSRCNANQLVIRSGALSAAQKIPVEETLPNHLVLVAMTLFDSD